MRLLTIILLAAVAVFFTMGETALAKKKKKKETIELDEAKVFIEWNSTDTDFGIQFFWDSTGFTRMMVFNQNRRMVLDVNTRKNLRAQGLTEAAFESVEPPENEEEFFARFPEGIYKFWGRSINRGWLVGEAEFTHTLAAPPENLSPAAGDEVSNEGFFASFDTVTTDREGESIEIEFYEVVVEKIDDEPILQKYTVILPPTQTSVFVPKEFLEPDTEYKLEIIAQEAESGNRTITETDGTFKTD